MDAFDDSFTDHPFVENAGQRTFSTFFQTYRFLVLMLVNFENAASNKFAVQKDKNLWMTSSEMAGY